MPASAAYDHGVSSFPPRFLEAELPGLRELTPDLVPSDPEWTLQLVDGVLLVSAPDRPIARDDFDALPDLPLWRYELHDGTLLVSPNAPSLAHQACIGSLYVMLRRACPPDLRTVLSPFEWLPNRFNSFQPDVIVARRPIPTKRLIDPPVLAVEVLSPSTRRIDETRKRRAYADLGVEHYWVVDPRQPSIEARLLVDGVYVTVAKADAGDRFEVDVPVPIAVDPAELLDG